jgi:uncharacterized membrane protein
MKPNELDRLERVVSLIMRIGVFVSASLLIAGLVLAALAHPWAGSALKFGLIVLMAIPAARILASIGDAVLRRDALIGLAATFVAAVLLWQFLHSL